MSVKKHFKETSIYSFLLTILILFLQGLFVAIAFSITNNEIISYFSGYLIPLLIIAFKYRKTLIEDAKNLKSVLKGNIKKIILAYIVFILLMYISNTILYLIFGNIASNEQDVRSMLFKSPVLMSIALGVLAPIFEELEFRYTYRNAKTKPIIKFFIYTTIFALMHISGDITLAGFAYIIPYFFLSSAIGYAFYKTNNIYPSMIAHTINNVLSIIVILISGG